MTQKRNSVAADNIPLCAYLRRLFAVSIPPTAARTRVRARTAPFAYRRQHPWPGDRFQCVKFVFAMVALLALTTVLGSSQGTPQPPSGALGPPAPSCHTSNYDPARCVHLSPAEARVVMSVVKASLPAKKQILMYTKYNGILLLYYQELQRAPCQNAVAICVSYGVLGTSNLSYAPYVNRDGPLPTDHLMATVAGEVDFSCIGHFTREAYAREHVPALWHNVNFIGTARRKCYWG